MLKRERLTFSNQLESLESQIRKQVSISLNFLSVRNLKPKFVPAGERDRAAEEDALGRPRDPRPGEAEPAPPRDVAPHGEQGAREAAARVQEDGRGEEELLREHGATHVRLQDLC